MSSGNRGGKKRKLQQILKTLRARVLHGCGAYLHINWPEGPDTHGAHKPEAGNIFNQRWRNFDAVDTWNSVCLSPSARHLFRLCPQHWPQLNFGESTKHVTVGPARWPRGTWIFNYVVNRIDIEKGIPEKQRPFPLKARPLLTRWKVYCKKERGDCLKRNHHLTSSVMGIILRQTNWTDRLRIHGTTNSKNLPMSDMDSL